MREEIERHNALKRSLRWGLVACALASVLPATAGAAWTSTASTNSAVMTNAGDVSFDLLSIGVNGSNELTHDRFDAGDAGFESEVDFDSTQVGEQIVMNVPGAAVTALGGGTADDLFFVPPAGNASSIVADITFQGNGGSDQFFVVNSSDATPRDYVLTATQLTGAGGGIRAFGDVERLQLSAGPGADTFAVAADAPPDSVVDGGPGQDRFNLADGADFFRVSGSVGDDTLDYSAYTTPVTIGPPDSALFFASLNQAQEVPPTGSAATGSAILNLNPTNNSFSFTGSATGITTGGAGGTGDLTMSHIHAAPPGVNGPIIFDLATGGAWADNGPMTGMSLSFSGAAFPPASLPDLYSENTYVNIHTAAHPDGEIRGRLALTANGIRAPATNFAVMNGMEHFVGGSAGDTLNGNFFANTITGGSGADTIATAEGADTLNTADGVADAAIDCGPGADVLNRDPPSTDADSVITGCETVNPPTPPPPDGGGGGDGGGSGGGGPNIPPANDIVIGKAKLNTRKGTAKLPVQVPGPGELELEGKGVKPVSKQVTGPGTVNLNVKPGRKVANKLDEKGKATVSVEATFTPTGGTANSETKRVKLKEK